MKSDLRYLKIAVFDVLLNFAMNCINLPHPLLIEFFAKLNNFTLGHKNYKTDLPEVAMASKMVRFSV